MLSRKTVESFLPLCFEYGAGRKLHVRWGKAQWCQKHERDSQLFRLLRCKIDWKGKKGLLPERKVQNEQKAETRI